MERELIRRALEPFDGNQTKAARYLDMKRKAPLYRMSKYGLKARAETDHGEGPEAEAR